MLLFNMNLPLVEITVALAVVMFILLLEAIILLFLFQRQLSSVGVASTGLRHAVPGGGLSFPSLKTEKAVPAAASLSPPLQGRVLPPEKLPPQKLPPVLKQEVLERELGRVQQELSALKDYTPPEGKVKTFIPPTGHEGKMVGQERLQAQENFFTRLLRRDISAQSGKEQKGQWKVEQKAAREVQRLSPRESGKTAPSSELGRVEEELARLKREVKKK